MSAPETTEPDGRRCFVYCSEESARQIARGFVHAGKSKENVKVEARHDWEGKYWVVLVD